MVIRDEDIVIMASYTTLYYFVSLFTAGFLYLVVVYVADIFVGLQNIFQNIFPSTITEQTIAAGNFGFGLLIASPALILIALAIWALVRGGST